MHQTKFDSQEPYVQEGQCPVQEGKKSM